MQKLNLIKKKFTLMELIIILAIFAILMTLLIPSLTKARESAQLAVCLSNEKQFGIGMFLYLKDNKGIMVRGAGKGDGQDCFTMYEIAPYLSLEHTATTLSDKVFFELFKKSNVFRCPSSRLEYSPTKMANSLSYMVNSTKFSLKFTTWGGSIRELGVLDNAREHFNIIGDPSKTGIFTESRPGYIQSKTNFNSFNFWNWDDLPINNIGILQFDGRMSNLLDSFHTLKTTAAFADGHGKIIGLKDNSILNEVFLTSKKF